MDTEMETSITQANFLRSPRGEKELISLPKKNCSKPRVSFQGRYGSQSLCKALDLILTDQTPAMRIVHGHRLMAAPMTSKGMAKQIPKSSTLLRNIVRKKSCLIHSIG